MDVPVAQTSLSLRIRTSGASDGDSTTTDCARDSSRASYVQDRQGLQSVGLLQQGHSLLAGQAARHAAALRRLKSFPLD